MVDTIEFYPVEVTKNFMGLTVGDILRVSPNTGRYELVAQNEDIGDSSYSMDRYEISLEPWIIQKYSNHFQVYDESEKQPPEEDLECPNCQDQDLEGFVADTTSSDLDELREDLEQFKTEFAKLQNLVNSSEANKTAQKPKRKAPAKK